MNYTSVDHTFMICAYQENPYLEKCILSILNQNVLGNIKISTSTPNTYILNLSQKYNIPLVINVGKGDAVDNFNFAYSKADTALVTLCHQDDYYESDYLENILQTANKAKCPIIIYTDYFEDRNGKRVELNKLLIIKRILNFPLRFALLRKSKWIRRKVLSFGCPICCPAVTYDKTHIYGVPFREGYLGGSFDWDAWLRLAQFDGEFAYCSKKAMGHRIWEGSATTKSIENHLRDNDEYKILSELWPDALAKLIFSVYHKSQRSNRME